ncbi:TPA: hypothetical protein ACJI8J_005203 [Kluyvera georgiana]
MEVKENIYNIVKDLLKEDYEIKNTDEGWIVYSVQNDYLAILDTASVYSRGEEFLFGQWGIHYENSGKVIKYMRQCLQQNRKPVSNVVLLFIQQVLDGVLSIEKNEAYSMCNKFVNQYLAQIKEGYKNE